MISVVSCWWALLADRELRFIYLSKPETTPTSMLNFQSSLLDSSLFVHLHAEEFQAAQLDFTQSFHQKSLHGSVTTCRFKLPLLSNISSHPHSDAPLYMVVEISLFGISDRLSIGFFHVLDTGASFLRPTCSEFILNDQELDLMERAIANLESKSEYGTSASMNQAGFISESQTRFIQIHACNDEDVLKSSALLNSAQLACFPVSNYLRSTLQPPFPRYTRDWNSPLYFAEDLSDFSVSLQRGRRLSGYQHWGSLKSSTCLRIRLPTRQVDQFFPGLMNTVAFFWGRYLFCVKQLLPFSGVKPPPPFRQPLIQKPLAPSLLKAPSISIPVAVGGGGGELSGVVKDFSIFSYSVGQESQNWPQFKTIPVSTSNNSGGNGGGGGGDDDDRNGGARAKDLEPPPTSHRKRVFSDQKDGTLLNETNYASSDNSSTLPSFPQCKRSLIDPPASSSTTTTSSSTSTSTISASITSTSSSTSASTASASSSSTTSTRYKNGSSNFGTSVVTIKKCERCGTNQSPEWRRGPSGHKTLCNACGLRYARSLAKAAGKLSSRLDSFPPRMGVYYITHNINNNKVEASLPPPLPVMVGQLSSSDNGGASTTGLGYWKTVYHPSPVLNPLLSADK